MAKKQRHAPEQINSRRREAEVKLAKGTAIGQVCEDLGVTEPIYYRWRKEYGEMKLDQARRLKDLEKENGRLGGCWATPRSGRCGPGPQTYPASRAASVVGFTPGR